MAVFAAMTVPCGTANKAKAQSAPTERALSFLGGQAMHFQKTSPISVEIVARCGKKFFRVKVAISVAALIVLVSTVSKYLR